MIRILGKRWPLAKVRLLPVRVQGVEAPPEIAGAIRYANEFDVADLIITGRGGGSIEDLWAFNDERVARAIYASRLPVISAVGHEPDVTISDYVADLRAATPSNAAELAVPDRAEVFAALMSLRERLRQSQLSRLSRERARLERCTASRSLTDPMSTVNDQRLRLDRDLQRLGAAAERQLHRERARLGALSAGLDAMSPLKVLTRGYAITHDEKGNSIRSAAQLHSGDKITLRLSDGSADCLVEDVRRSTT
jgi:exodeoxyribonuclease VII large subunit